MEQKFRKLKIWQKSIDFIEEVYKITKTFPKDEQYGLINQIRRASTSIALNIAEGSGCDSDKDFNRFLSISLRSTYEVMCGMEVAKRLTYCDKNSMENIYKRADEISAMISGLKKKLKANSF